MARRRLFISYSHEDIDHIGPIIDLIRFTRPDFVFQDLRDLKPDDLWEDTIFDAIDFCRIFVLFWCEHSAHSQFVRKEIDYALGEGKDFVPLLLDDTELNQELTRFQAIDLRKAVFHKIKEIPAEPEPPPPPGYDPFNPDKRKRWYSSVVREGESNFQGEYIVVETLSEIIDKKDPFR